ncbi:uncharacterized protein LOC119766338 [Culex quinquefasciatus]|uniref:uncharacterized protein LOC119766338 n=1 Tax=Culex quinquefasciatus TaxID=7176 RepID=UPI0018E3E22E|nr:uncharacterized protein LOC119766338 [Culex quinquefasciatus]
MRVPKFPPMNPAENEVKKLLLLLLLGRDEGTSITGYFSAASTVLMLSRPASEDFIAMSVEIPFGSIPVSGSERLLTSGEHLRSNIESRSFRRRFGHPGPLCVPLCSFVHFVNTAWFHPGRTPSGPLNHLYEPSAFRWTVLNRQAVTVIPANPNPGLFRRSPRTPSKPVARHQAQEGRERLARVREGCSRNVGGSIRLT